MRSRKTPNRALAVLTALTLATLCVVALQTTQASRAQARDAFAAPFMGWSTWSDESSSRAGYGTNWLTEQNVKNAADSVHAHLQSAGYNHIDIDAWWDADLAGNHHVDGNGIPSPDSGRFPDGISGVASYVHALGLKLGIYDIAGLPQNAYDGNYPIAGTSCHTKDVAVKPLTKTNKWGSAYKIDYSNPCAQAFIDSVVDKFASWGVDLIKVDGVTQDNIPDIRAWSTAIDQSGRQMWLTASAWPVDLSAADGLSSSANSVRVDTDVECYCDTITSWSHSVSARWSDLPAWLSHLSSSYLPDLDSMPINNDTGSGVQDGINDTERQTVMNFWSLASSPLYVGGDVYFIDQTAINILTNPEVVAVDQSSVIPRQVSAGNTQIWAKSFGGATYVGVFNLGSSSADITVDWSQLGLSGTAAVRDLDARANLGSFSGSWTAPGVPSHGSRLIKITGGGSGGPGTTYEADAPGNIIAGAAAVATCPACSDGHRVGYIGNGAANYVTIANVQAASSGTHTMTIDYLVSGTIDYLVSGSRAFDISVNGGADIVENLSGTSWSTPASTTVTVSLKAGTNTIKFHNDTAYAPDLADITIS